MPRIQAHMDNALDLALQSESLLTGLYRELITPVQCVRLEVPSLEGP